MNAERILKLILRLTGAVCLLAIIAVYMPPSWMAVGHEWSGLGEFPDSPIVEYLARATSAFYAMFGGLLLLAASDVRRHSRVIAYAAWMGIVYGVTMSLINMCIGMPWYWALGEVATAAPLGAVILLLLRAARRAGSAAG